MNWKITEETIRNLCRDGEGGVRADPASLAIAVDGLLHALAEVQRKMGDLDIEDAEQQRQIDFLGKQITAMGRAQAAAKHDCCTACTDGDGQPLTGLRSLVGKRVHLLSNTFEFPVQKARVIAVDGDWLTCRQANGRTILLNAQYAGAIHIVEDAMP